ncbi:hypothetical protein ACROYT_G025553 [Oculina patagonica]
MIKTKLADNLGRIPWSNNHQNLASYVNGEGGLSQQKLLAIMSQLTNDIRVNGRKITPLQTQIVKQSSDGEINPTLSMDNMQDEMQPDMQNDMQDDMQSNKQNDMQDDMQSNKQNDMQDGMGGNEIKPIDIPMNQRGSNGGQMMRPGMFERMMFGGLSQIMGGGRGNKGYSDFGGGMANVPGLSFGGSNNNGVINLMESGNGLKPMTGMNGMGGMNRMHGMMNGMGMMMNGMGRMRGRMWGGGSYFSRRGETNSHKKKARSKHKIFLEKAKAGASTTVKEANKTHQPAPKIKQIDANRKTKQYLIPFFVGQVDEGYDATLLNDERQQIHTLSDCGTILCHWDIHNNRSK